MFVGILSQLSSQDLPWHFEAFRRYVVYRRMQQAASVLTLYEGETFDSSNPAMDELLGDLQLRTGEDWLPKRKVSDSVEFNVEGDFYRNKGRLLTSFFIIEPKDFVESGLPLIRLTQFGQALGNGFVSERQYYEFIVKRIKYPHPAYEDNWQAWTQAGRTLRPLIFILQILLELYESKPGCANSYATSEELATFAYPQSSHEKIGVIADSIIQHRIKPSETREYSDEVNRKINDMLGFLCIAGFTFYDGKLVRLNLLGVHPQESAYYWEKRKTGEYEEASTLRDICNLIRDSGVGA